MKLVAAPWFASEWPDWAQFLVGVPLRIVIVFLAALIAIAVTHSVVSHTTARMARTPSRPLGLGRMVDPAWAAARREARFKTLGSVLNSVATVAIWVLAACLALEAVGVNVGLIITSLGVAGVAVGLGAQSLVKDVVAGVFMLAEDQYGVGDEIDTGDAVGVVESMSLRVTTLRDADGVIWHVPNGAITRIGNKSQGVERTSGPPTPPPLGD